MRQLQFLVMQIAYHMEQEASEIFEEEIEVDESYLGQPLI